MSKSRDIADSAATINYIDGLTSDAQTQIDGKEPADATILKDADIGSTVQAYDSNLTTFLSAIDLPTADGTNGQVMSTNGSGVLSFVDSGGGGTEVIGSVDITTSTTSVEFTSLDNDVYIAYRLICQSMFPAASGRYLISQVSSDNGSSWVSSGYGMSYQSTGFKQSTSVTCTFDGQTGGTAIYLNAYGSTSSATSTIHADTMFYNMKGGDETLWTYGNGARDVTASSYLEFRKVYHNLYTTTEYDAIKVSFNAGSISSGRVVLLGIKR